MSIYTNINICIYTHTHTHTHTRAYIHIHIYTHAHIHIYIYTHTHTNTNQLQTPILNPTSSCMTMWQSQKCANSQISRQNRHVVALSCRFASCKRTLYLLQKSPIFPAKEPYISRKRALTPPHSRDIHLCAKELNISLSVGLKRASPPQKRRKSRSKEPNIWFGWAQKRQTSCSPLFIRISRLFAYEMNMTLYEGFLGMQ